MELSIYSLPDFLSRSFEFPHMEVSPWIPGEEFHLPQSFLGDHKTKNILKVLLSQKEVQGHHLLPLFSWDSFVSSWSSWSRISLGIKDTPGTKNILQEAKSCSQDSLGLHFAILVHPRKKILCQIHLPIHPGFIRNFFPGTCSSAIQNSSQLLPHYKAP